MQPIPGDIIRGTGHGMGEVQLDDVAFPLGIGARHPQPVPSQGTGKVPGQLLDPEVLAGPGIDPGVPVQIELTHLFGDFPLPPGFHQGCMVFRLVVLEPVQK